MGSMSDNNNLLGARSGSRTNMEQDEPQIHVSGIFIVLLEVALIIENSLPILVVITYLPSCARGVGDRLIAALSVTCILSALIPTPLGLASYFTGSWYGGSPTCSTYQVTSTWCNLSALALLSYICVNCHFAVSRLLHFRTQAHILNHTCRQNKNVLCESTSNSQQGSYSPSHLTQETAEADCNDHHATDQSSSTTINCHDVDNAPQKQFKTDFVQTELETGRVVPGMNVSSFEYSKLEFLTDNSHAVNSTVQGPGSYNKTENVNGEKCSDLENSELQLENCGHNPDSCLSHHHQTTAGMSDVLSTYNTIYPSHSQENAFSKESQSHGQYDMTTEANALIYENSTFLYASQINHKDEASSYEDCEHQNVIQNADLPTEPRLFRAKDYISIALFFLYSITLTISSLPVVGFGPQHDPASKLCRSWLVPTPHAQKERVFFIAFLTCVYVCMLIGCATAARVGYLVSKRVKQEMRRTTRLYHEEENVPDIRELSVLDDLKRHHNLSCLALCGILTWLPIAIMLTLQKAGIHVSEATLVYSNIATSLPCLLNPLLYSLVLARYREGYKAILERCRRKKGPQKPHQLRNVHHCCENDTGTHSDLISTSDGHRCIHGRPNPTFDSCSFDEDILDDDEDDDEEENYDNAENFSHHANTKDKYTQQNSKLSEKTPLHMPISQTKATDSRISTMHQNKKQWSFPSTQPNEDEKCLLTNEVIVKHESETML